MGFSTFTARPTSSIFGRVFRLALFGLSVALLIMVGLPGFIGQGQADHVDPQFVEGNALCGDLGDWDQEFKIKEGQVTSGEREDPGGPLEVTLTVQETNEDGEVLVFDWSSNIGVDAVFVKGGPGGNLYLYDPEETSDDGLHAPFNEDSGEFYAVSHISFCYDQEQTGDVALTKEATGDVPEGATFTFDVDCTEDEFGSTGIELTDDQTETVVDGAPADTECTITETDDAGADTTTFEVDGTDEGETDSVIVIVRDDTTVEVVATNDFEEEEEGEEEQQAATFTLSVLKVDATDTTNTLEGADFSLFADRGTTAGVIDDADPRIDDCTTDTDGTCEFTDLLAGDYLLAETDAPEDFVPSSDEPIAVAIVDADRDITVTNEPVDVAGVVTERPGIELEKTVEPATAEVGETVTYTFTVTNTGETTLTDLTLTDDQLGAITLDTGTLEPGASTTAERTYVVTQADAEAGEIVNVATVSGMAPSGEEVSAEDDAEVGVVEVEGVTVTRPGPDQAEAGELPRTGASTGSLLTIGLLTLAAGVAVLRRSSRTAEASG